jgi:signal transduction histidine kinase
MQIFSLIYLVIYSGFFGITSEYIDFILVLAIISSILFAFEFYENRVIPMLKDYKELIRITVLLYIALLSTFYHYLLFEYAPYSIVYGIFFISTILENRKKFNPSIIYVAGWSFIVILLYIFDFRDYYIFKVYVDTIFLSVFVIEATLYMIAISYKYNRLEIERSDYKSMLLQQSKMATMGQMLANITHQFRQPLNSISYILMNIKKRVSTNRLDTIYFDKKYNQANEQIQFLSKTIDAFKDFYIPSKIKESFDVVEALENALIIISANLNKNSIEIVRDYKVSKVKVYGVKNELSQVVLSIISNACEVLGNKDNSYIKISIYNNNDEVYIEIGDNGGGIDTKSLPMVFEPYYSTKKSGSGIGLYIVKRVIIDSFGGKISVSNSTNGAIFKITLKRVY